MECGVLHNDTKGELGSKYGDVKVDADGKDLNRS